MHLEIFIQHQRSKINELDAISKSLERLEKGFDLISESYLNDLIRRKLFLRIYSIDKRYFPESVIGLYYYYRALAAYSLKDIVSYGTNLINSYVYGSNKAICKMKLRKIHDIYGFLPVYSKSLELNGSIKEMSEELNCDIVCIDGENIEGNENDCIQWFVNSKSITSFSQALVHSKLNYELFNEKFNLNIYLPYYSVIASEVQDIDVSLYLASIFRSIGDIEFSYLILRYCIEDSSINKPSHIYKFSRLLLTHVVVNNFDSDEIAFLIKKLPDERLPEIIELIKKYNFKKNVTFRPKGTIEVRKPRLALCISGQLRGFKEAWPVTAKAFERFDYDVFVTSWDNFNVSTRRAQLSRYLPRLVLDGIPSFVTDINQFEHFLPNAYNFITRSKKEFSSDEIIEIYNPKDYSFENEIEFESRYKMYPGMSPYNSLNQAKMYYGIYRSAYLANQYSKNNGIKYDLMVRLRHDASFRILGDYDLSRLLDKNLLLTHSMHGDALGDRFFLSDPDTFKQVTDAWLDLDKNKGLSFIPGSNNKFGEHYLMEYCVHKSVCCDMFLDSKGGGFIPAEFDVMDYLCSLEKDVDSITLMDQQKIMVKDYINLILSRLT